LQQAEAARTSFHSTWMHSILSLPYIKEKILMRKARSTSS